MMPTLTKRIASLFAPGPEPITSTQAQAALAKCRQDLEAAHVAHKRAVFANATGEHETTEQDASAHVTSAEKAVERASIILAAVLREEAEEAALAKAKAEVARDDVIREGMAKRERAATQFAATIKAYVDGYADLIGADNALRQLCAGQPHIRQDLFMDHVQNRIGTEITRLTPHTSTMVPPGGNAVMRTVGNPADLPSLVSTVIQDHVAIGAGLKS